MTLLDIHPEHLIDRVLRGLASASERAELDAHMRVCAGCTAEWQLAQALGGTAADAGEHADGDTRGAVDAALATLVREGRIAAPGAQHAPHAAARGWLPWAVAACLFFTGSAAAATLIVAVKLSSNAPDVAQKRAAGPAASRAVVPSAPARALQAAEPPNTAPAPQPVTAPAQAERTRPRVAIGGTAPALRGGASSGTAPALRGGASSGTAPALRGGASSGTAPALRGGASLAQKPAPGVEELFAQARAAAMRGEHATAAALFVALEQRFAASDQAHVSQVLLGRLYLERLGDAPAALRQFDAYLKQGGANRPEALLGRARALRKLGREHEEIATLRELVDAYPDSLYVAPAEQRLRAVE